MRYAHTCKNEGAKAPALLYVTYYFNFMPERGVRSPVGARAYVAPAGWVFLSGLNFHEA